MQPTHLTNEIFTGASGRDSLYDLVIPKNWNKKLIVFIHGYMGYKDWGCWNLVMDYFTEQGYAFLKYNVSHNGGTIDNPIDFSDLDAFSENSYAKEIVDFESILSVVFDKFDEIPSIYLIGHSRGGGIALLQSDNGFVKKIATWASIASIKDRFPTGDELETWKVIGVYHRENGRTLQQMPHNYSQHESFLENQERLDIEKYCRNSTTSTLVIHGDTDVSVPIEESERIADWLKTKVTIIPNAGHTFDAVQPWEHNVLPEALERVCNHTLDFFNMKEEDDENKERLSLLAQLVQLAQADSKLREQEFNFLSVIAKQLGVSPTEFKRVFEENIDFQPPKFEADRILQFQRLVLMMHVDRSIGEKELRCIREMGIRMGLNPAATNKVLERMGDFDHGIIPPDELMAIFQAYHN